MLLVTPTHPSFILYQNPIHIAVLSLFFTLQCSCVKSDDRVMITVSRFLIVYLKCVKQVLLTVAKAFVLFLQYVTRIE